MKSGYLKVNKWLVALIFVVLVLVFFWKTVFLGSVTVPADVLKSWYPWKYNTLSGYKPHNTVIADVISMMYPFDVFVNQSLKDGDFPLWNPYIFSGTPFIAKGAYVFYPIHIVLQLLFSPLAAHQISVMLHLFLAGIFMYSLMKSLGIGEFSSLISGIIYMFNGLAVAWIGFKYMLISAALLPLLVLTFKKSIDRNGYFYSLLSGIFLGLILISGLYTGYYALIFLAMYSIFYALTFYREKEWRKIKKALASVILTVSIGILLSAVQLLPMLEFIKFSTRNLRPLNEIFPHAWTNYLLMFSFFIPKLFGVPTNPDTFLFSGNLFNEFQGYAGILPFMLAVFAAVWVRKKIIYFFSTAAVFSLLLSAKNPLYLLFYHYLPGFNNLEPGRILFLYVFCISILAGFGMDYILSGTKATVNLSTFNWFWTILFSFILAGFSILNISLCLEKEKTLQLISNSITNKPLSSQFYAKFLTSFNISNPNFLIFIFIFSLSILLFSLYAKNYFKPFYFQCIAFGLIVLDLFSYGINYNTNVNPRIVYPKLQSLELLHKDKSIYRTMSLQDIGQDSLIMPYATKMPYNIQDIDGYDNMYLKSYAEFMQLFVNGNSLPEYHYVLPNGYNPRLLNLLNVKYVLTPPNKDINDRRLELIFNGDLRIYRNNDYLPRVFIVPKHITVNSKKEIFSKLKDENFDVARTVILEENAPVTNLADARNSSARIISYKPDTVEIEADMKNSGFLVLADAYYPGWQAFIDGKKDRIYRAYHILRAIRLNQGRHKVKFEYHPKSFVVGRNISILTILFISVAAILSRPRKNIGRLS